MVELNDPCTLLQCACAAIASLAPPAERYVIRLHRPADRRPLPMRRCRPFGAASQAVWIPRSGTQEKGFEVYSAFQAPRIRSPALQESL